MKIQYIDNVCLKLGENAQENWDLISKAKQEYYWVHLQSFPSGHIIVESMEPSEQILQEAGLFCLKHTKFKNLKNIFIIYTKVSNLVLTHNIGEVEFKSNRKTQKLLLPS